ncbi:MAG: DmsE family decaheme c-type cytochrome [Gallionellaceae bacterium]|nr:DmsE family decaheme c-type cytochrome [Gallionellaceae bacterium]
MNTLGPAILLVILSGLLTSALADDVARIDDMQCAGCHKIAMQTFKDGVHGHAFSGDAQAGCQSCHGAGAAHKEVAGQDDYAGPMKIESFKKGGATPADQNRSCLTCHENNKSHANWRGSAHDMGGVSCADCHNIHAAGETVRAGICFTCHQTKRAQVKHTLNPMMPRGEGAKECAKCHDPHGGKGPGLLKAASVNETCYGCHSEKRGPFLWEHAPVRDDCTNCHDPHGTANANFLKSRLPYLCQNCHSDAWHPSQLYSANSLTRNSGSAEQMRLIGKACLNCHGLIHGSNHPSGARFQR